MKMKITSICPIDAYTTCDLPLVYDRSGLAGYSLELQTPHSHYRYVIFMGICRANWLFFRVNVVPENMPHCLSRLPSFINDLSMLGLTLVHCGPLEARAHYLMDYEELPGDISIYTFSSPVGEHVLPRAYGTDPM